MARDEMTRVGIRELQEKTGQVISKMRESGEPLLITFRNRAVAALVPVEESVTVRSEALERLAEAERQGARQPASAGT